jgi:antitoxin component YwqK of YwqJK toxin-antitoxin module
LLDQHTGVETWWHPNGQLHWRRDYRKGQDTTMVQFYKNGDPERLEVFKEDRAGSEREVRRWYEGKIQQSVFLTQTRPDGYQMQSQEDFYPSGVRKSYVLYKNQESFKELYAANGTKILYRYTILDSLEGPYQRFDTTGVLLFDYRYHKGLRNGWCREYDATGKLQFAQYYQQGNPVKDSENLARKHHFQALTSDEKRGLQYLFSAQQYDSIIFEPAHQMKCLELLYRVYPEVLGTLPVNEIRTELDFYRPIRLQFQTYGPCTAIHVNNHHLGVKSFLIYPDMEIEPLQHLFTKEDLQTQQLHHDKFELWQD